MKPQRKKKALASLLCMMILAGCSHTDGSSMQSSRTPDSSKSMAIYTPGTASFASSADTPLSAAATPSVQPAQDAAQNIVYKKGSIGPGDGDHLEIPAGLDEDEIAKFVNYLTIAIVAPLSNVNEMDADTAFRFSRCMLEFYYETHPESCARTVEIVPGSGDNYNIIPASDFLAFILTHFGIDDIAFFQKSIPDNDRIVKFQMEEGNILLIPSLEAISSDFKTGFFTVENGTLYLQAESADLGILTYCFDISNGLENYRLTWVQ